MTTVLDLFKREKIGCFPTPVRIVTVNAGKTFWVKDDGLCGNIYGGNKVRKLEYLLPFIAKAGKNKIVIQGDVESHTVTACALYGRKMGFHVTAVVFPYKNSFAAEDSTNRLKNIGIEVIMTGNMISALLVARLIAVAPGCYLMPMSATTPISTLGYVNAAFELAQQIEQGDLPSISRIYISFATGGTVAGLLIGFALAGLPVKIVAVRATEGIIGNMRSLRRHVSEVLALLGRKDLGSAAMQRLETLENAYLGGGYRSVTDECRDAAKKAEQSGLNLDLAFTAKTMAAVLKFLDEHDGEQVLFWNTHDQAGN